MKLIATLSLGLVLVATLAGRAQAPAPARAAAPDTAGHVKGGYGKFPDTFYLGELVKADGTHLIAYLPSRRTGYERRLDYFLAAPGGPVHAKRYSLKMPKVQAMTVRGHYYETVRKPNGKATKILAQRLLQGPIELLTYAEPRAIPIPIPLGVGVAMPVAAIPISDKHHWYLRRNGVLTEMRRGNFRVAMSQYLFDYPELAQKVAAGQPGYQHRNVPAIVAEYNRYKGTAGTN